MVSLTRAQLAAPGFGAGAIAYRVKVGRLHLLHRGVHAVGHRPPAPLATAMAAVLACGPTPHKLPLPDLNAQFRTLRITDHRLKEQEAKEAQRLRAILRNPA
jgi:hypothetical protein